MTVFIYLRVSTKDQAESRAGLNAQHDACLGYLADKGTDRIKVFEDAGVSGAAPLTQRPALSELLVRIRKGDTLLVKDRSRLSRDRTQMAIIEADVRGRKARIVSVAGEGTADDSPESGLYRGIADTVAEYERAKGIQRTKEALAATRARGKVWGRMPYGLRVAQDGVHYELGQPWEVAVIGYIVAWEEEGLTQREMIKRLHDMGFRNRHQQLWSESVFSRLLQTIRASRPAAARGRAGR